MSASEALKTAANCGMAGDRIPDAVTSTKIAKLHMSKGVSLLQGIALRYSGRRQFSSFLRWTVRSRGLCSAVRLLPLPVVVLPRLNWHDCSIMVANSGGNLRSKSAELQRDT